MIVIVLCLCVLHVRSKLQVACRYANIIVSKDFLLMNFCKAELN